MAAAALLLATACAAPAASRFSTPPARWLASPAPGDADRPATWALAREAGAQRPARTAGLPEDDQPAAPDLLSFVAIAGGSAEARLFVWDEALGDSLAIPGAGTDVGTSVVFRHSRVVFNRPRAGGIFWYDLGTETIGEFPGLNQAGFAMRPSITADGKVVAFVANPGGEPGVGPGTRAYAWIDGVVAEFTKAGPGMAWARVSADGSVGAVALLDGRLFLYSPLSGAISQVIEATLVEDGFAHHPNLRGDGGELAWVAGRTSPQRIYLIDVATFSTPAGIVHAPHRAPRPLEYAAGAFDSPIVTAPRFAPRGRLYFEAFRPDLGVFKAYCQDPVRGIGILTTLNATVPDDTTIYTGVGVP